MKIQENVEAEIHQVILEEARDSYDNSIIWVRIRIQDIRIQDNNTFNVLKKYSGVGNLLL